MEKDPCPYTTQECSWAFLVNDPACCFHDWSTGVSFSPTHTLPIRAHHSFSKLFSTNCLECVVLRFINQIIWAWRNYSKLAWVRVHDKPHILTRLPFSSIVCCYSQLKINKSNIPIFMEQWLYPIHSKDFWRICGFVWKVLPSIHNSFCYIVHIWEPSLG